MKYITKFFIVAAIAFLGSVTLRAQQASGNLHYLGRGDFVINGSPLAEEEMYNLIGDKVYYETYLSAQKQRKAGLPIGIVGAGLLGATTVWYAVAIDANWIHEKPVVISSAIGWGIGAIASAGFAFYIIGNKRLKWIAEDYNRRNGFAASFQVGPTPNGVGVLLNLQPF